MLSMYEYIMKVFCSITYSMTLLMCLTTTHAFHIQSTFLNKVSCPMQVTQLQVLDNPETEFTSPDDQDWDQSASRLRSLKFIQLTSKTEPALLADYLMEVGASSVSITDHDAGDPNNEKPIFAEPDKVDTFAAVVCGDAAVGKNIWMRCDVNAHFADSFDILDITDQVRAAFDLGTTPRFEVDDVPDLDWIKEVQSSWKPVVIGGFVLRFPWHTDEDVKESLVNADINTVDEMDTYTELLLEGGIAFGTGEHPTTQLCLEFITELVKDDDESIDLFLDYGAGSGVLGMAACKLKPELEAIGVEIDADAIRIADANSAENGVNMKSYLPRHLGDDNESASLIMKAMQRSSGDVLPEELDGPCFDACAANILAGPLISLAETIASMLKPGARLGLSGILEWQGEDVVEAYSIYFDDVKVEDERGGWVLVTGTRK